MKQGNCPKAELYTAGRGWAGMKGGSDGDKHIYEIGVVFAKMAHRSSIFEGSKEGAASSPLGGAYGDKF